MSFSLLLFFFFALSCAIFLIGCDLVFFKHLHFMRFSHFIFGQLENIIVTAITTLKTCSTLPLKHWTLSSSYSIFFSAPKHTHTVCLFFAVAAAVAGASSMHRCWGESFNFIIWVGWHAHSLFHPLDTRCHKSTQTSHFALRLRLRFVSRFCWISNNVSCSICGTNQ